MNTTSLVLIVMDGWGLAPPGPGNPISQAKLKTIPRLWNSYPHTSLLASGQAVGLPNGEDGNTEVGHINLGAGRVVLQDLLRINTAIEDGTFQKNEAFIGAIRHAQTHQSNIHLMGVFSDAGVHASRNHICALLELLSKEHVPVYLHLFTDGRDAPPQSALSFFKQSHDICEAFPFASVASVIGRCYAMDRDRRWDRTELAYEALVKGSQYTASSVESAIEYAYKRGETDEFIKPTVILDAAGQPLPRINNNDAVIFFNYRIDRPRQLTRAFVLPDFEEHSSDFAFDPYAHKYYKKHIVTYPSDTKPFVRSKILENLFFVTLTEYERNIPTIVAFPPQIIRSSLGEIIANTGMRQLRASESEKERFVTYYFNCMREDHFPGEDRLVVPSPKVATYDLVPQMSAIELTNQLLDRLSLGVYQFILVNFANPDMVGHTGNIPAAIKACETVDACIEKIVLRTLLLGGTCLITADHGNVEEMLGPTGGIDTEHSSYPVPFIIANNKLIGKYLTLPQGKLADVAPTALSLLSLPIPDEMTGTNLLKDVNLR